MLFGVPLMILINDVRGFFSFFLFVVSQRVVRGPLAEAANPAAREGALLSLA